MMELTLNQVEKMRQVAGDKIAEAIYEFEKLTGLRVDAVSLVPYYIMRFRFSDQPRDGEEDKEDNTSGRKLKIKFEVSI